MTSATRNDIDQDLADAGIPKEVIRYIEQKGYYPDYGIFIGVISFTIMLVGMVPIFYCTNILERSGAAIAYRHAEEIGGVLYSSNIGVSFLIIFVAWILASILISSTMLLSSEKIIIGSFISDVENAKSYALYRWMVRRHIDRYRKNEADPSRYIRIMFYNFILAGTSIAALLFALGALAISREVETYKVFTPTAYVYSPFLPWQPSVTREWNTAIQVATGCVHGTGRGRGDYLIYTITLSDGTSVGLGHAIPVKGNWVTATAIIDQNLRASGAKFVQTESYFDRASFDSRCIRAMKARFSASDFERLRHILRF